ncbi:unnamed protein product, partial [Polarella glacialis]
MGGGYRSGGGKGGGGAKGVGLRLHRSIELVTVSGSSSGSLLQPLLPSSSRIGGPEAAGGAGRGVGLPVDIGKESPTLAKLPETEAQPTIQVTPRKGNAGRPAGVRQQESLRRGRKGPERRGRMGRPQQRMRRVVRAQIRSRWTGDRL